MAAELDDLFTVAPDEFIAARNALAKSLRAAGQRDVATNVAALRRPSIADWALNVAAHDHPDAVRGLIDAAAHLREVQASAIEGRGGDVRSALAQMRTAAGAVHRLADDVLARSDRDRAAQAAAITRRLSEVAANPGVAEQLQQGRLGSVAVDDVDPFAGLEPATTTPRPARKKAPRTDTRPAPRADAATRRQLERNAADARRAHDGAVAALAKADGQVAKAQGQMTRAQAAVDDASRDRDRRAAAVEDAARQVTKSEAALERG